MASQQDPSWPLARAAAYVVLALMARPHCTADGSP